MDDVVEQWTLPTLLCLEQLGVLAQLHREHFALQIDAIGERLRAAL